MEKSMRKSDVHPLRSELQAHKISTIPVLAAAAVAAFLNVGSRGAVKGDPTDTPTLFLLAFMIVAVSGIIVSRVTFADTYDVAARDAQHTIPVNAWRRFLAKVASIMLRHVVPILLFNAVFIVVCAVVNAFHGSEIVDIRYSCIQTSELLCYSLAADCLTVLTMACTGTVTAEVICGFAFGFVSFSVLANVAVIGAVDKLFGFGGFGEYSPLILWCVIATLIFFAAGTVYASRDGRHTGKHVAGPAAWEMLAAGAVLYAEVYFGLSKNTWLIIIALLVAFLALHFIVFHKDARKELPRAYIIFTAVTLIYIAYALYAYANSRGQFFGKDRNGVENDDYMIEDADWEDERWRRSRKYANEPDCELMIGSRVLSWIDSGSSDEYHISNADGSLPDKEDYKKLVEALGNFCSENEIKKDTIGDVLAYIFCGASSKYEGTEFGFQVTISYGEGRFAHRERCTGYILYKERVPEFLTKIEEAGFIVRQVPNSR